jgi:asparagine synthase (glutamine-hydrolysing)
VIANRKELARREGVPGHLSDNRLLEALYRRYDIGVAGHIFGDFAWMLWDGERRRLIAATDRVGAQRLYYANAGNLGMVANRLTSMLDADASPRALNLRSAIGFLTGRQQPPTGETFYHGIQAVPPGHVLVVTTNGSECRRYWRLQPQRLLRLSSDAEYAEALRQLLFQVVAEYATPDRSGIMLSSGMDSTAVATALRETTPQLPLDALCWTAPSLPEADEGRYQALTRGRLGLPGVEIRADEHWPFSGKEGIVTPRPAPYFNAFAEAWETTYREATRRGIRILFTGSGGDNLFGSIAPYPDLLLAGRWLELVRELRRARSHGQGWLGLIRRRVLGQIVAPYNPRANRLRPPFPWLPRKHWALYRESFSAPATPRWLFPGRRRRLLVLHWVTEWSDWMRIDLERTGHRLEFRSPLQDHRLQEFAASLPATQTCRRGVDKRILRNALRGHAPDAVVDLPRKIVPLAIADLGLRQRECHKVWPLLKNMRAAELGLVDQAMAQTAYQHYLEGRGSNWFLYPVAFEDWLRRYW